MEKQIVEVKSAFASTTNWVQFAGLIATVITIFKLDGVITVQQVISVLVGIQAAVGIFTIIWKTWFSKSITRAVAKKL